MRIVVAGATGFIGTQLILNLLQTTEHQIVALSRHEAISEHPRLESRACDLYSLLDTEWALEDCDVAIYLVHSMSPSSRLSQGSFKDFDFLLADNFAKAAVKNNIKHIVYLSGIIPPSTDLSEHLLSRLEVEQTLQKSKIPLTTLRCGLVIGPNGSSFRIVERLVERLPIMLLPKWTHNRCQVIYINDIVEIIKNCIHIGESLAGTYDLGIPEEISYSTLMRKVSRAKKMRTLFIPLAQVPMLLSKPWVAMISNSPLDLVSPLIDSLKHDMLVSDKYRLPTALSTPLSSLDTAISESINSKQEFKLPLKINKTKNLAKVSTVQSVQRLPLPEEWSIQRVANHYTVWLQDFLWPLLTVKSVGQNHSIYFWIFKKPLLVLKFSEARTFSKRPLFYITGGMLVNNNPKARLEFRESPYRAFFIVAIHSYTPSLPWYIYRYTQALLHAFIMRSFGRYLKKNKNL